VPRKRERASFARVGFVGWCGFVAACASNNGGSPNDPPCVTGLTADCAASYAPPTFDAIFTNVFQTSCAVGTGTCHTSDFGAGGIVFADESASYATLLGADGGTAYVLPGDPGCSTLMKRLESTDPNYHMPKGPTSLSAGDLCTIVQWIANGAAR
jgi:hypothetical protein